MGFARAFDIVFGTAFGRAFEMVFVIVFHIYFLLTLYKSHCTWERMLSKFLGQVMCLSQSEGENTQGIPCPYDSNMLLTTDPLPCNMCEPMSISSEAGADQYSQISNSSWQ